MTRAAPVEFISLCHGFRSLPKLVRDGKWKGYKKFHNYCHNLLHGKQWRSQKFRLGGARLKDKIGNKN